MALNNLFPETAQEAIDNNISEKAKKKREKYGFILKERKFGPFSFDVIDYVALGTIGAFMLVFFIWRVMSAPVLVQGHSMMPTLRPGDVLLTQKATENNLERGVIIVFREDKELIKRLVGIPGDTLVIKNGYLYVNNEKYDDREIKDPGILSKPLTLKENEYFALGDNRNNSRDCREFGPVSISKIQRIAEETALVNIPIFA